MPKPLKILLIDGDPGFREALREMLGSAAPLPPSVSCAAGIEAGIERLGAGPVDAILLGFDRPDSRVIEDFLRLRAAAPATAVLLLSGADDAHLAPALIEKGAQDYIPKERVEASELWRSMRYAIERKRLENELARLAYFPDHNPNPIFEIDDADALSFANKAAREAFPDLAAAAARHPLLSPWAPAAAELRAGREILVRDVALGERVYQVHLHRSAEFGVIRVYVTDVTERVRVDRLKEEFLHNVSHELRSPLAAVEQALRMFIDGQAGPFSADQGKVLEISLRNVLHLRGMLDDLFEVTRAETGKLSVEPRRLDAGRLAAETVATLAMSPPARGVSLTCETKAGLLPAQADPARLRQVLINLVDNALKFTPKGGSVKVRVELAPAEPGLLLFSVSDTGPGIRPEEKEAIFQRLRQGGESAANPEARKGLGLGLYLCRELVARHGGRVWVESPGPGKGSLFRFTLPIFSMPRTIKPLALKGGKAREPLCLIRVDLIGDRGKFSDREAETLLAEGRRVLRASVLGDDLLLPETAEPGRERSLYLLAETAPAGARSICERLRARLAESFLIANQGLKPSARAFSLRLPRSKRSPADHLDAVAARIERLMRGAR